MKSYNNVLKRGCRIALRAKVNDSLISGLSVVDSILPVLVIQFMNRCEVFRKATTIVINTCKLIVSSSFYTFYSIQFQY